MNAISKQSMIPFYYQLKEILREQIRAGRLKAGEMLPSVSELIEIYGVSRHVANRALAELTTEGLIVSRKGVGSFVNHPRLTKQLAILGSFTQSLKAIAAGSVVRVLKRELVEPDGRVQKALELGKNERAVRIDRIGCIEQWPIALVQAYYPMPVGAFLLERDLTDESIYRLLAEEKGIIPMRADMVLSVTFATLEQAGLLEIKEGFPLVCNRSQTYDQSENPFEVSELNYRSDRVEFAIASYRRQGQDTRTLYVDL